MSGADQHFYNYNYLHKMSEPLDDANLPSHSGSTLATKVCPDSSMKYEDHFHNQTGPDYETLIKVMPVLDSCQPVRQAADSQGASKISKKLHQCGHCKAIFMQKHHLTQHVNTHIGNRPYKCDQCTAAFTQKHSLNRHLMTHTGEKPYKCMSCSAVFSLKHGLRQHSSTHTGEKPFKCDVCNSRFSRKFSLDRHQKVHDKASDDS